MKVAKVKLKSIAQFVLNKLSAPKYYSGSFNDNKSGLQVKRVIDLENIRKKVKLNSSNIFDKEKKIIDNNGFVSIKNYFDDVTFKNILKEINDLKNTPLVKKYLNKNGYNIDWLYGQPTKNTCPLIYENFQSNKFILEMVEHVTKRKVKHLPIVSFEGISKTNSEKDNVDPNRVIHADRFYPTIKVVLYLSDVKLDNGPFHFAPKSHIIDDKRLKFEKQSAIYNSLLKDNRNNEIPKKWIENNRIKPPLDLFPEFEPKPIMGKANTLSIINTCGFHFRGEMQPGSSREAIRLIFHYVYSKPLAQDMFKFLRLNPSKWLN